ncbi:phosphate acetyltransferase, partial [Candidatus Saccharibacteria bacterium]|nr:phosphate acetyltransferase [Candidatus Saccharibacteria bacterium]
GFTAAGPILQGFKAPVSDLSRGSTAEDVLLVIETLQKLVETRHG